MSIRVKPDGTIEVDTVEEALELQQRLRAAAPPAPATMATARWERRLAQARADLPAPVPLPPPAISAPPAPPDPPPLEHLLERAEGLDIDGAIGYCDLCSALLKQGADGQLIGLYGARESIVCTGNGEWLEASPKPAKRKRQPMSAQGRANISAGIARSRALGAAEHTVAAPPPPPVDEDLSVYEAALQPRADEPDPVVEDRRRLPVPAERVARIASGVRRAWADKKAAAPLAVEPECAPDPEAPDVFNCMRGFAELCTHAGPCEPVAPATAAREPPAAAPPPPPPPPPAPTAALALLQREPPVRNAGVQHAIADRKARRDLIRARAELLPPAAAPLPPAIVTPKEMEAEVDPAGAAKLDDPESDLTGFFTPEEEEASAAAAPPPVVRLPVITVDLDEDDDPNDGFDPASVPRPRNRSECRGQARPCPWVGCSRHIYLSVDPKTGAIEMPFPDKEPWQLPVTCVDDIADKGGATLEEVGQAFGVTRERIRQIETKGLKRLKHRADHHRAEFEDPIDQRNNSAEEAPW